MSAPQADSFVAAPLVPREFVVPESLETTAWRLRRLTVDDVDLDFDAVASSRRHLQLRFGPGWPAGLTRRQNLVDLGWHEKEFQRRTSFAYTLITPDEDRILGCVYIEATHRPGHDAEVRYWVRESELARGLEDELGSTLRHWIASCWPFRRPYYRC